MPRLIVKIGGASRTVELGEDAVTLGRTPDNSIPVAVEGVSRKHAQILFIGKGWEVVDLGSRNGTKINGQKVKRAMLKSGDVIDLGGAEIVFEDGAAGPAADDGGGIEVEELDLGGGDVPAAAPAAGGGGGGSGPTGDCVLRIVGGEKEGTTVPLKTARTTFGRRSSNTVSFQDSAVSGVHCEITRESNGFVLRDLGSTNGTLVDGEPVVEAVLRHNSRIRVGAQRIVFVDTSVADIESSLTGADDASEWGLMRGELDVEGASRRTGKGALVASLLVVAAAGAGGWFVVQARPQKVAVTPVKDNRIGDFSFEEGVVRWFSPGDRETALARIDGSFEKPRGASGVQCLEVVPQGEAAEGPGLVVFRSGAEDAADAAVTPDVSYEIGARVGGGTGAVVVQWTLSSRPGLVREVCSPPVQGNSSWPETKVVVTAPAGVTGARILLAAFDGEAAAFDDIVFRRADGGATPVLENGDLKVRIDGAGCLEAVRGGEILLTQGGLAPGVDTSPALLLGATLTSPPSVAGSALTAKTALRSGGGFVAEAEKTEGGTRLSVRAEGAPGSFTFTLPAGLLRGAVTLVQERTAVVLPEAETFKAEGVVKIIVGTADGPRPFVMSVPPGSAGWDVATARTTRGLRMQLVPRGEGPASVLLNVDLSRENEAAVALLRDALNLETAGKAGAAIVAFEQVMAEYHYLPDYRSEAEKKSSALLTKGRDSLRTLRELSAGAVRFRDASDLETVARDAGRLAAEYEGHVIGTEAGVLATDARAELGKVREEKVADRVERLYQRASDYEGNNQFALALLLMDEIIRLAPEGNDYRDGAQEKMPGLRAKMETQQKSTFGSRR